MDCEYHFMLTLSAAQNDDKPAKSTTKKVYMGEETQNENATTMEKTLLFSGQKRQDFQTLSCCGLAWAPSPSALPCWRITAKPQSTSIKGARPAVRVSACYLFYRPRTVGKRTVESSECQKSWSSSWPQRPQGWVTGSTYTDCLLNFNMYIIFFNTYALCQCISPLCMIYSNIWIKVGQ